MYRKFVEENPSTYEPVIARTLHNLAFLHKTKNEYPKAKAEYEECLLLLCKLVKQNPAKYKSYRQKTQKNYEKFLEQKNQ